MCSGSDSEWELRSKKPEFDMNRISPFACTPRSHSYALPIGIALFYSL